MADHREMFEKFFENLVNHQGAFSLGDKLALVERLLEDAEQRGSVPVSPTQMAHVSPESPHVQAIIAGREVSLGGSDNISAGAGGLRERMANLGNGAKVAIMVLILLLAVGLPLLVAFISSAARANAPTPTASSTVQAATEAPTDTPAPVAVDVARPTATSYALVLDPAEVAQGVNDPVSVEFGGIAFALRQSRLVEGEWLPAVAEWLPGTELRRVLTVPYSYEVGQVVAGLSYYDPIKLRLNSGEVVTYHLVNIERVKRHQIEVLTDPSPSLVIVLHGERSNERYVMVGIAEQGNLPPTATPTVTPWPTETLTPSPSATLDATALAGMTVTPTLTPTMTLTPGPTLTLTPTPTRTPTITPTPVMAFTPPLPVVTVITETQTVVNETAGLQLTILGCNRVESVGTQQGEFMVCNVQLTALRDGVAYSGQTLAVTEYAQVSQVVGWWPPALDVVGAIGDGTMQQGNVIGGVVAGEVAKSGAGRTSDPVLLWEQSGIQYVIYLEP